MPIGVIINSLSVLIGGLLGAVFRKRINTEFCGRLTLIFGVCSMGMGVYSIIRLENLPPVIIAVVIGTMLGEWAHLEARIAFIARKAQIMISRFLKKKHNADDEEPMLKLISIVVLFCASGTGIFGALQSGITGDHTILISKSILDFFTAAIFAVSLGTIVMAVAIPQFLILGALFFASIVIMPMVSTAMLDDFTACGGILMLATGFRMSEIKSFPVASMIPAMILVMPLSWLWVTQVAPLL